MRTCSKCKKQKPDTEFYKRKDRPGGLEYRCKSCQDESTRVWHQEHPDKNASYKKPRTHGQYLRWRYGITGEEYERRLAEQHGVCAVCSEPSDNGRRLSVDHDHVTGEVRGLLCHRCNTSLGMARDDVDRLMSLAAYLLASQNVLRAYTPEQRKTP